MLSKILTQFMKMFCRMSNRWCILNLRNNFNLEKCKAIKVADETFAWINTSSQSACHSKCFYHRSDGRFSRRRIGHLLGGIAFMKSLNRTLISVFNARYKWNRIEFAKWWLWIYDVIWMSHWKLWNFDST